MRLLQMPEVFFEGANDSRIAGIDEQTKRVPEAKSGLHRTGVDVEPPRVGIRAPPPGP
jgi:hypothetical protein